MVSFLIPLLIGTILGFLAGMGVGGGSLLLLWLTQIAGFPYMQARILNLLFYLPAAATATVFHRRKQVIQKDTVIPALLTGCTAAVLCALLSRSIDPMRLQKYLGWLLIGIGIREVFYRPRKAR